MELSIYHIDAFASELFKGNPAAVCPLEKWLPDDIMQSIAFENNLSETAFFVPKKNGFHIRWFSPTNQVNLCGHATLASAYVIFNILSYDQNIIEFDSKSGLLKVIKDGDNLILDFPAQPPTPCKTPQEIINALNNTPIECLKSEDFIAVLNDESDVQTVEPDFEELKKLGLRGVIITAQSKKYDFIARCFFPGLGIQEDPVTGSAYTQLAPYWANKLGKNLFNAKQLSARGGELICELYNDRVLISGKAVKYMEGKINI
ncbi:MAG: PhzF family phenazine biosynthesis protein [Candidatus Marinimicrobia bacterium]|nr:PhzF family phenazine biosynthesis protein [Candidatus Neomarinimicrobiota bacterium]